MKHISIIKDSIFNNFILINNIFSFSSVLWFSNKKTLEKIYFYNKKLVFKKENILKIFFWKIILFFSFFIKVFSPFEEKWAILIKKGDKDIEINPPKGRGWSDPFIVKEKNKYFIFFEEYILNSTKNGILKVGELKGNNLKNIKICLKEKFHLSYPFVFKEGGTYYMIPETYQNNKVTLYKSKKFPYKWEKEKTLINGIFVDNTLLKYKGFYYIFSSGLKGIYPSFNENITVFKSKTLKGKYKKIYENQLPNILNSRMGGNFIKENNKIFRVVQNCSKRYGYEIHVNEVISIEPNLIEKTVKTININRKKYIANHTYNKIDGIEVLDVKKRKFSLISSFKKIRNILYLIINRND